MDQNSASTNPVAPVPEAPVSDAAVSDAPMPNPAAAFAPPASDAIVEPTMPSAADAPADSAPDPDIQSEVVKKIAEAQNVLVALSSDPSVDEMAAAIGLSLFLDKLGKRATAIYSGSTPNALEFLKPEETFEPTADTLQDFVIALNKEKADHLRYKLDGEYVKIFITPYKTRIGEEDLEFSYGDYNVDLVLALDVANGIDLDSALREHGRIMHDAVIINITTGNPGKFGEIEWSDKSASSVSEMIAKLLYSINSKAKIEKEEATAFLTGIVAATNRFSNAKTTPNTMQISSRLMQSGANQQLISKNITPDVDNELYSLLGDNSPKRNTDPTKLDIEHGDAENVDETKEVDAPITEETSTLLDDLKAAEVSLATAGSETVPDTSNQPVKLDSNLSDTSTVESELNSAPAIETPAPVATAEVAPSEPMPNLAEETPVPTVAPTSEPNLAEPSEPTLPPVLPEEPQTPGEEGFIGDSDRPEKVVQPPADMDLTTPEEGSEKYGKMLEDAISGLGGGMPTPAAMTGDSNPASMMAPQVASTPEINGVPEINYMPMPGEEVLPPPPAPPIDMSTPASEATITPMEPVAPIQPAAPPVEPTPTSLGPQPAMQDQVYAPQASDPGAFKIPGVS
ncbi:hypothetical protein IJG11_00695 [Candidatus Saccharibacteria bacterium]|nr:hypothetical protein [Candidatus Saccharibacteria bacterium]